MNDCISSSPTLRLHRPFIWAHQTRVCIALSIAFFFAVVHSILVPVQSALGSSGITLDAHRPLSDLLSPNLPHNLDQTFMENFTLESGESYDEDLVVISGNVKIEGDAVVNGDLTALSGKIEIEPGGVINGDVTALSGNATIAGKITGDLAVFSGNVDVLARAHIDGDISVLSGKIHQDPDAVVNGDVESLGDVPFIKMPEIPRIPAVLGIGASEMSEEVAERIEEQEQDREPKDGIEISINGDEIEADGIVGRILYFVLRVIGATFGVGLITTVAGAMARLKPTYVEKLRQQLRPNLPANFGIGLGFNVIGYAIASLTIGSCLFPLGLFAGASLLIVDGLGLAALGAHAGRRLTGRSDATEQSIASVVLGVLVMAAPLAFLWAVGGWVQFIATVLIMSIAGLGAGTVLQSWFGRSSFRLDSEISRA